MQPMKIMTMIWPTSMARHRSARQLRMKMLLFATDIRTMKHIIAIAMKRKRRITAIAMKARSLIITMIMSITTTTDAIWQRS